MEARVIGACFLLALLGLSACGDQGSYGLGPMLDTQSKDEKDNDKWFRGFYGTSTPEDKASD